ncbi:MAG: purine-nucleoside phosphorylase [Verrucomicrobiales bacterium]|nr:purine-nucleoside phosphorylase [Verrucomicrobiales bacterium]MCP5527429.1 purine-nucleoside phosphorylase [Verrucomicrobiales bacterium]
MPDPAEAAAFIRRRCPVRPEVGVVLGSGFRAVEQGIEAEAVLPYDRIPGFCQTGVVGHAGRLSLGRLGGVPTLLLAGRAHFYEGYSLERVTFPVRVAAELGVRVLLLTNAAGGINQRYRPGHFMILRDHINLMGLNPLCGCADSRSPFVDLTEAYDPELRRRLRTAARQAGAPIHAGVYLAVAGPSYETPAEIRAFARLGADAVGMSTVPETIVARHCGLRVAGLSAITNLAAGRSPTPISHEEVLVAGRATGELAGRIIAGFVRRCVPSDR